MSLIRPFRGYRYNEEKVGSLSKVTAPPYDSITKEQSIELKNLSEYNIIKIMKGLEFEDMNETDNPYASAKKYLSEWIESKILLQEKKPAIYMYEQRLFFNHISYSNRGFVVQMKLCDIDKGHILSCEKSVPEKKEDRVKLMNSIHANLSMVNCMYIESENAITKYMQKVADRTPDNIYQTQDSTEQRLWVIDDEKEIQELLKMLDNHTFYLVDGQNRYEVAQDFAKKCAKQNSTHTGNENYNYIMTLLTNAYDDGLMQAPFHRLIKFPKGFKEDFFVSAAQDHFKIEKIIVDTQMGEFIDTMKKQIATKKADMNRFAVYTGQNYFYRLTLRDKEYMKLLLEDKSQSYIGLDVTVLNKLILEDIFNITEDMYKDRITYTKSVTHGIQQLKEGTHQCMICTNAVKAEQIRNVALEGEKMPEKSICVFPKPAVGVIINKFD